MAAKTTDPIDILLEMGIDLDNLSEEEDYLSALKEAIATIEFKTGGKGDERSAVLREEVIKVRKSRKATDTKFKAKKTTIKPENLFGRSVAPKQKTLSTSAITPYKAPESEKEEGAKRVRRPRKSDPLKDILKGINTIIAILNQQQKLSAKQAEKDRKRAEKEKREGAEDKLEDSGVKRFASGVDKIIKPVKGLLDGVFDFIKNVLIGTILIKIINWFSDPENAKKIEAIGEFFKATWPAILATFIAFKLKLGGFIVSLLGLVGKFVPKLLGLIPKMLSGLKTLAMGNPLATAAVAVTAGTAIAAVAANQKGTAVIEDPEDPDKSQADEIREFGGMTGAPMSADMLGFSSGGQVPGGGPNRDTVPAMLAPGEFVVSRGAVQKYGADTFAAMNAAGGGTNLPKRMNGVTYAVGGGLMGDYDLGEDKKEKQSAQVEKEMKDREKMSTTSENPVGNFFSGIGKALGFGGKKEEDKSKEDEVQSSGGFNESSLKAAMDKAGYTDPTERAMFLAQMAHESGNFQYDEEIHDGSNYEGRSDLGNTQPGDGRKYKGRGYIQLTGRANYKHYGDKLGVDLENNPQLAKRPDIAAAVAVSYWDERVNRNAAREGDVRTVTYNINGGYNGLADREAKFKKYVGDPNYSAPGGGLKAPYSSPSGTTMASLRGSGSRPAGGGIATLFGNRTVTGGGSPSGTTMASLSKPFKAPPGPPPTPAPVGRSSGPATGGSQQGSSPNRSAKQIKNQNSFPDIDANAMISMEKVKTIGLTLA